MKTSTKIVLGVVGVAVFFLGYNALVVIQREKMAQVEEARLAEQREKFTRELDYDNCISDAETRYYSDWDSSCKIFGKKPDCTLPGYRADEHNEQLNEDKDRCVTLYK